ncbi:hypothetical protein HYC85_004705 [Camellia sinensis]|uniref:Uncharacterized protein n=1 Tax=Camellia sinensis TaxID=4442 RepID=A0A7J7HXA4_CAMSI|nr:hypothetical protein HYC85_004705 [Camellia sinensis]
MLKLPQKIEVNVMDGIQNARVIWTINFHLAMYFPDINILAIIDTDVNYGCAEQCQNCNNQVYTPGFIKSLSGSTLLWPRVNLEV